MKRHKINRKGKVNLRCEVCELDFTRSSNLKRHVEIIHNCDNKDTDLISPHCKKKYKRLSFLKEHMPKCKAELEPNPKKKEVKWSREKKRSIVEHITQRHVKKHWKFNIRLQYHQHWIWIYLRA